MKQVKELEHANRRFKVKIDMLEREKITITKKYEGKLEDMTNKINQLDGQLAEWTKKADNLENKNREIEEKWEAKLAAETQRTSDLELSLEESERKYHTVQAKLEQYDEQQDMINEYETVLGKLMERNAELEQEVKKAIDERDMANRQVELSDRRRTLRVKELEEKIEEQKLTIEQQQETLDESVKTILKLYSLNNGKGDDMSTMSEERLTDIARSIVPRMNTSGNSVPSTTERPPSPVGTLASGYSRSRLSVSTSRARGTVDENESLVHDSYSFQSRPRLRNNIPEDLDGERSSTRPKSRGRGERTRAIQQLTARARSPNKERTFSPVNTISDSQYRKESSNDFTYDPSGPESMSRALVPIVSNDASSAYGGQYDIPPESVGRRGGGSGMYGSPYEDGMSLTSTIVSKGTFNDGYNSHVRSHGRQRQHHHHHQSSSSQVSGYRGDRGRDRDRDRDRDRNREVERERDRDRDRDRDREWEDDRYYRGRDGYQGSKSNPRPRESRGNRTRYDDEYSMHSRKSAALRDPSLCGETIVSGEGRAWSQPRRRPQGHQRRSRPAMDP